MIEVSLHSGDLEAPLAETEFARKQVPDDWGHVEFGDLAPYQVVTHTALWHDGELISVVESHLLIPPGGTCTVVRTL